MEYREFRGPDTSAWEAARVMGITREQFNVWLVGILSLLFLVSGAVLLATGHVSSALTGGCVRLGLILGALWLALPTRGRAAAWANISPWWVVGISGGLFYIFWILKNPKPLFPLLLVAVLALMLLNFLTGRTRR